MHHNIVILRQPYFAFQRVFINHGAHHGGKPAGGAVEVDILIGRTHMALAPAVIQAAVNQMQRGILHKTLPLAERNQVLIIYVHQLVGHAIVFPGAGGGEHKKLHVLQVARGRNGALAMRALAPGYPQNFCQGLVIYAPAGTNRYSKVR